MRKAARRPRLVDVAIAAGCASVAALALAAIPILEGAEEVPGLDRASVGDPLWWATVATLGAQALALLWTRVAPRVVLLVVVAMPVALALAAPGAIFSLTRTATTVAVLLAVLTASLPRMWATLAAATVLVAGGELLNALLGGLVMPAAAIGSALAQPLAVVGLPALVGAVVVARREARAAHDREMRALAGERDALVRAAVAGERAAMARELHDVAAHHMSGIALMAAAIEREVDADPARAKRSVRAVRSQSTAVLDDLRRLVGLLRDDGVATRSVETLASLPDLVEARRAHGVDVELRRLDATVGARHRGIGPLAQLVAHRMVQEALSNMALHAPGARGVVEVDDRGDDAMVVRVRNEAPTSMSPPRERTGFGLIGMRERAELVGASLDHGPGEGGGWEVRLTVPRERRELV